MDLGRASDRKGLEVESWKDIDRRHVHVAVAGVGVAAAGQDSLAGSCAEGSVRGKGRGLIRSLGRRPCRFAHRTPALYSRIKPRTNKVPQNNKGKEGAGQLAELLKMILKRRWIQRGSCGSPSRCNHRTISLALLCHYSSIYQSGIR